MEEDFFIFQKFWPEWQVFKVRGHKKYIMQRL